MTCGVTAVLVILASLSSLAFPLAIDPEKLRSQGFLNKPTLHRGTPGFVLAEHQSPPDYEQALERSAQSLFLPGSGSGGGDGGQGSPQQLQQQCRPSTKACTQADERYRTFDGTCNNLRNPSFGSSGLPFVRFIPRKQSLVDCGVGSELPNPRAVSRIVIRRGEMEISSKLSLMLMVFGQIIDHDIELTPPRMTPTGDFLDCCAAENAFASDCCPINTPSDDPFYGREKRPTCIPFLRSRLVKPTGCGQTEDVVNMNTPWIDASFVYGSDANRAKELRSFKDGQMNSSIDNRKRSFPPITFDKGFRMQFGDNRGDVHPGSTLLTTAFLRNHNRIAADLKNLHPDWNDEIIFQEARKVNVAILQHITYTDFIDALLGTPNNIGLSDRRGQVQNFYDSHLDGAISMGFGTAGFRLHTYVAGNFVLRNELYQPHRSLQLRNVFHNPLVTMTNNTYDDLMRGLSSQPLHQFDNIFTEEMTEWLFRSNDNNWGMDIAALNVQRGRDHQIPGYPTFREFCGLGSANSWAEMADLIPADLVHRLLHTYRRPEDVDLYVGGNMEAPVVGSLLGPTFHCYVREQFERLRNADRFFYTNPGQFTPDQLASIGQQTLARVLCDNADDPQSMALPKNMFKLVDPDLNPLFRCSNLAQHPKLNMNAWR